METQITKRIFQDHWLVFQLKCNYIFDYVKQEVEKTLACRDPEKLGFHKYICPDHPEHTVVVPHSCKSRFCNACSKVLADKWIERASSGLPDCWYWHITLTVPKELRPYFLLLPELKDIFFRVGSETILGWFKERKVLPALISAFHSHGRDLKFHPHLHCVLSCGGLDLRSKLAWVDCGFIPFKMLRERWKVKFLLALEGIVDEDLRKELLHIGKIFSKNFALFSPNFVKRSVATRFAQQGMWLFATRRLPELFVSLLIATSFLSGMAKLGLACIGISKL